MVQVTKADGTRQPFSREKVAGTALRLGASPEEAGAIAGRIETGLYDGAPTSLILRRIYREVSKGRPEMKDRNDLRKALSLIQSKPDFELFVQALLAENGYQVTPNEILKGTCGEHEADAIASKGGVTYFVEVKHHRDYHVPTGLDDGRIARAIAEDVQGGAVTERGRVVIDGAMIVCNTKLSEHAKRYADCRGIDHIGWGYPPGRDIRALIEARQAYPVTLLKGLSPAVARGLALAGVVTLRQLVSADPKALAPGSGADNEALTSLQTKARQILSRVPGGEGASQP